MCCKYFLKVRRVLIGLVLCAPGMCYSDEVRVSEVVRDLVNGCLEWYEANKSDEAVVCLKKEYAVQDAILNKKYSALIGALGRVIEVDIIQRSPKMPELLKESQRKWISFRDKECEFVRSAHSGEGSAQEEVGFNICMIEQTYDRAKKLDEYDWCENIYRFGFMCLNGVG